MLAPLILRYIPRGTARLVEPFSGSGAISFACASNSQCKYYWLNDINRPLSNLLALIVSEPREVASSYESLWRDSNSAHLEHYYSVRAEFNRTGDPRLLLYLLARCVKGSVRYNRNGEFNQSPDKRRLGRHPVRMRPNLQQVSLLLRGRVRFTSRDYSQVFSSVTKDDVVYMDPPYQGVSGNRDHRYSSTIEFDEFVAGLEGLNKKSVRYLVSYDGRSGGRQYGKPLPQHLDLQLVELEAGRSTQATFLGRKSMTVESLYLSRSLADELETVPSIDSHQSNLRTQSNAPFLPLGEASYHG